MLWGYVYKKWDHGIWWARCPCTDRMTGVTRLCRRELWLRGAGYVALQGWLRPGGWSRWEEEGWLPALAELTETERARLTLAAGTGFCRPGRRQVRCEKRASFPGPRRPRPLRPFTVDDSCCLEAISVEPLTNTGPR